MHLFRSPIVTFALALLSPFSFAGTGSADWQVDRDGDSKAFIENKGQFYIKTPTGFSSSVVYGYDGSSTRIFFTKTGVTFSFIQKSKKFEKEADRDEKFKSVEDYLEKEREEKAAVIKSDLISYRWEGANTDPQIIAENETGEYFNYSFYSSGKEVTETNIKGFQKLTYRDLYPGIDIVYTFHPENGIKYAIIVHPGADISKVKMIYSGKIDLDASQNISIPTKFGRITDHAPVSFYADNTKEIIPTQFIRSGKSVSFILGAYDNTKTLIIDPWVQTPALPNSNKVWETETDKFGNVYIYGGDSFMKLLKYNSTGVIQWTYTSPWDSANYWIGGFITDPNGNSYMTSGSNGEIRKITPAGAVSWSNNPNGLTSYEYWSLAFNCDQTRLYIGGTKLIFGFPITIRGYVFEINLANGTQANSRVVGYGSSMSIPPNIQEVSSICMAPTGNLYFLTLDTVGSINQALNAISFKRQTSYNFDYYIPGYGFGTKQPISCIRASTTAFYTMNGGTLHKRDLNTGNVLATVAIPGGIVNTTFFGTKTNGNGGLDVDTCGNVYVGSGNAVLKYDANLNLLMTAPTTFPVYDVDVNYNGEVAACGWSGGVGRIQTFNMGNCRPLPYICVSSVLSASSSQTNVLCNGQCTGTATAIPAGGTSPYTYLWAPSGGTNATATGLCAGSYTCTVTDAVLATTTVTVTITQPTAISSSATPTNVSCNGGTNGQSVVSPSGGTGPYTYSWAPSGGTNATATGLGAGTYSCYITDANGCTHLQTTTISQPTAIIASASSTPTACSGNTGTATATASGGTGTLTYSWAPSGGTNANATGLGAGTYTVYVTDANGCTQTATTTIGTSSGPTASLQSQSNVLCNGGTTGAATVSVSGGQSPYTYSWAASGGTNANATGLGAGTYTCYVTDANGCTATQTVTITQPTAITGSTSTTNATCNSSNGTATVTASGGTGTLNYSWTPSGGTNANATGLGVGLYTVYVTDANGCTQTFTANVASANGPAASVQSQTNVLCFGGSTGDVTVSVTGGTSPYTYLWSPSGGTNATASGLSAGTYTVTVTDANGCTSVQTVTITQPTIVSGTTSTTQTGCSTNTGTATVVASGGTGPYTYSWSSGGTAATENGLGIGTYTVTITDANGCTQTATATVTAGNAPTATLNAQQNVLCNGGTNGTASVNVSGGTSPYTYAWSPSGGTNASASGLGAGTYTVLVTDANGCTSSVVITITEPAALALTASSTPACGLTNGVATANVSGGTSPYAYSWSPSGGTNSSATGLSAGTYSCVVTDANGCTQSALVIVVTNPYPTADAGTDVTITMGNNTILNATGGGTYSWSTGETTASITVAPTATTSYCVVVTSAAGCTDSACVTVTVDLNCGELFIPTAFSPNNDNENDVFKIYGGCIKEFHLSIYDRWGEKVWETNNPADVWDGIYKGEALNTAVFVYHLEATLLVGDPVSKKGNISLIR